MSRRYTAHRRRRVHLLDGDWDFAFLGDVDPLAIDPSAIEFDSIMAVPGCFDAAPAWLGQRGLGAYRARCHVTHAGRLRLVFDGVNHWCRVFVSGRLVAEHTSGFVRFAADFPAPAHGNVEVVVLVDNRFDAQRAPLHVERYDWYQHGGICRSVRLHELPPAAIDRVQIRTLALEPARLEVTVFASAPGARTVADVPLRLYLDERVALEQSVEITDEGSAFRFEVDASGLAPWSPEHPNLGLLGVELGDDDLWTRFGLRTISVGDRCLLLSGTPLHLRGLNRHEAHPEFGHSLPPARTLADLSLLRDLGANFLRGCHYPQDPALLDLCDELGIMVFCEGIGWQQTKAELTAEAFITAQEQHLEEMVLMAQNHPCVILWGLLNESESAALECHAAWKRLIDHLRSLDPTRPVTFASNRHGTDTCLDLVDVISVNAYPGWYFGSLESIGQELDRILDSYRAQGESKPILVSEIGAGAIYGCRDSARPRWSEELQADILDQVVAHLEHPATDCIGFCLWQFCDCRTNALVSTALARPRGFNNKGLLDEYRRPKLAWHAVRARLRSRD